MYTKISFKGLLFVVGTLGFAISSIAIFMLLTQRLYPKHIASVESVASLGFVDGTSTMPIGIVSAASIQSVPIRLIIPKINIDAAFDYVGVTSDGAMDAPKGPTNVGWFELGSRPGEVGSAVVAGHYGWKNGIPAVFDRLSKLKIGDKVFVLDESGATTTYAVSDVRTYGANDDASRVFYSADGKAHLNLVTCQGAWNKKKKSYANRLVVFTEKEAMPQ